MPGGWGFDRSRGFGSNALIGVSIEITMENNSEGSEVNLSPVKEDVYYGSVARRRNWLPQRSDHPYGMWRSTLSENNHKQPNKLNSADHL